MFEKFFFCFKHKTAAVLMAVFNLNVGIFGTVNFGVKVHCEKIRSGNCAFCEDYLIFSVFHLLISAFIVSALIWEKPILILIYELIHISTLAAFLVHTIIHVPAGRTLNLIAIASSFLMYCMYCVYLYYVQLKLKKKSHLGMVYYFEAVYFCNSNVQ